MNVRDVLNAERLFVLAVDAVYALIAAMSLGPLASSFPLPLYLWPLVILVALIFGGALAFLVSMNIEAFAGKR